MLQNISVSNKCCSFKLSMISEGSCDTEDWSNDAENSALHSCKLIFKTY